MTVERTRKTPLQQIAAAREALSKAQARQRSHDTRSKIILGALARGWLLSDPRIAQSFLSHVGAQDVRAQDKDALVSIVAELKQAVAKGQTSVLNTSHS